MLKIEHVSKNFGKKRALDDICLDMEEGCYGLLGPNGAGKTTLIRMILELYSIKKGSIQFEGTGHIGYLPQKFGAFQELTVRDILLYFAALKKIPKVEQEAEIDRVLELVNLSDRKKDKMSSLSGGMQRRVGIAQAVLGDPSVLIFDEPTAGLDPEERTRFKKLIRHIMDKKIVIISTHIVEDVETLCDRVIIMNRGRVLKNLSVEEVSEEGSLEKGFLCAIHEDDGREG